MSRDVMQHSIHEVTVAPKAPCFERNRYNASPNQQFWFPEIRNHTRPCGDQKGPYKELGGDLELTEWDVHLENGILTRIDDTMHASYSFFPSSAIKKEVPMKFFQR